MKLGIIEVSRVPILACKLGINVSLESRIIVGLNVLSIKSQLVECNLIQTTDTIQRNPLTTPPLIFESRRGLKPTIAVFEM